MHMSKGRNQCSSVCGRRQSSLQPTFVSCPLLPPGNQHIRLFYNSAESSLYVFIAIVTMTDSAFAAATSPDISNTLVDPSPVTTTAPSPSSSAYVNPSQMVTPEPQAGPSHYRSQRDKVAVRKRRRDEDTEVPRKSRDGPKKKKANRACAHCQKAHLTCDDCGSLVYSPDLPHVNTISPFSARPCQRCIKRGIASTCTEGHRKKAKYLLDDDELRAFLCCISAVQFILITCP